MKKKGTVLAFIIMAALVATSRAQNNTFIGAANGAYIATNSWSLGVRPTSDHDVIINNGVNARLASDQNGVAGTLTIGGASGTSILEVRPNTEGSTASITVAGNLTLAPGAGSGTLNVQFPGAAVTLNDGKGSIVRGAGAGAADLVVANWSGSLGLATATVDNLNLAQTGATTFNITSDQTYNVSDLVRVNNNGNGVVSVLNINGGMLNLGNSTTGPNDRGQLWFNSGTAAGNNTTVNLNNGGTLIAKEFLRQNEGSAVLNFNDGKIATRSDADLIIRSTAAGPMDIALAETGTHTFEAAEGRTISVRSTALLKDKAGEKGTLTKTGAGSLIIQSASTYTGATAINAGTLQLTVAGALASERITVANGAFFDVSALTGGTYTLADGQALIANGTVTGGLTVGSGEVIGGDGTVTGALTLQSGALFAFDPARTLTLDGTLTLDSSFGVASLRNSEGGAIDWSSIGDGRYTLLAGDNLPSFNADLISNYGAGNAFNIGGGRSAYFENGSLALVVISAPGTLRLFMISGTGLLLLPGRFFPRQRSRNQSLSAEGRPSESRRHGPCRAALDISY